MKRLRVGVDCDVPLFPYPRLVRDRMVAAGIPPSRVRGLPSCYRMWCCYGVDSAAMHAVMDRIGSDGGLLTLPPVAGAVAGMRRLAAMGHEVVVVTARGRMGEADPARVEADTHRWLADYGIPHDRVVFTNAKHEQGLAVLLDDLPAHSAGVDAAGGRGVLYDRPWNRGPDAAGLHRVRGWRGFTDFVDNIA